MRTYDIFMQLHRRGTATYLSLLITLIFIMTPTLSACSTLTPNPDLQTAPRPASDSPTIALVLGGGGAKGFSHIGVIKVLEENDIIPNLVVGTSIGSLVGSLYASGYTPAQLEQLALTTSDSELTDFVLSNQGFIEGLKLKSFINTKVGERNIEDFPIQFAAVAAEKNTLQKAVFTTGNSGLAVQASSSVPNIFIAPRIPEKVGKKYIDGGVVSLVPVDSARDLGADIIIAVDVMAANPANLDSNATAINPPPSLNSLSSFWAFLENTIAAQPNSNRYSSMRLERDRADIVITPNVSHISSIDTSQRRVLIAAGAHAITPQINAIKQLIEDRSHSKHATP